MEDNPYVKFLGAMRDEARGQMPEVYRFGTVESVRLLQLALREYFSQKMIC